MNIARYDGSFLDFVRVLTPHLIRGELPEGIEKHQTIQPALFQPENERGTTASGGSSQLPAQAQRTLLGTARISRESWQNAWLASLSETINVEMIVARYLLLALEVGEIVDHRLTDERVAVVQRLARRVTGETHRFKGLLRFKRIEQRLFYAPLHPDAFVLPLLAPFFAKRLPDQSWIIHDQRREIAAVYDQHAWVILPRSAVDIPTCTPDEPTTQELWRGFFDSIAVRERLNLALQQQHIPKKYWKDLIELPGR